MSHLSAGQVFARYPGGASARQVLTFLVLHLEHKRLNKPIAVSAERLADLTGLGLTEVRAAIRELRRGGYIVQAGSDKGGRGIATPYTVNVDKLMSLPDRSKFKSGEVPPVPAQFRGRARRAHVAKRYPPATPLDAERYPPNDPKGIHRGPEKVSTGDTEQGTSNKELRTRESAQNRNDGAKPHRPREPKPAALSLQAGIEIDPELPNRCRTEAATLRPDLTPEQIATSWASFVDHAEATGHVLKSWLAGWRKWIRRENADKVTQAEKRAETAARMHANIDELCEHNKPAHASHRIFESTATTVVDPPAEPSGQVDRLDTAAIVVDLSAKFTGNAAPAAPATPPAPAGTTPEDSMHNDQKRSTPPINLSAILNKRMPRVETEEQRAARMEAERQRQVAELRARGINI